MSERVGGDTNSVTFTPAATHPWHPLTKCAENRPLQINNFRTEETAHESFQNLKSSGALDVFSRKCVEFCFNI